MKTYVLMNKEEMVCDFFSFYLFACVTPKLIFKGEFILFTFQVDSKLLSI